MSIMHMVLHAQSTQYVRFGQRRASLLENGVKDVMCAPCRKTSA
jgi:hypothetical protein